MKTITKEKSKLEIYREEILKIEEKGKLTAENVVEESKDKNNPLHDYFEWDNKSAGNKWRVHQARLLINYIIEPVIDDDKNKIFSYEIINMDDGKEYKHYNKILSRSDWRNQIITQATGHLLYWRQKYNKYKIADLDPILIEIEKLDKQNGRKRK